jgi:hypothetical protein
LWECDLDDRTRDFPVFVDVPSDIGKAVLVLQDFIDVPSDTGEAIRAVRPPALDFDGSGSTPTRKAANFRLFDSNDCTTARRHGHDRDATTSSWSRRCVTGGWPGGRR